MKNKDKRQKTSDDHEFVKDGMETNDIKNIVQDIMLYIEENRNKMKFEEIIGSLKGNIDRIEIFESRYPLLYEMITRDQGFDYNNLEYFFKMRENIIQNKMTGEDASKIIGQVWYDKYCKNSVEK
tara:strand:- start:11988 stop:12362 length:375 start_codon:yes stop_codon:yes gene_type:complete